MQFFAQPPEAVINPGNPTGTILTRDVIEAVVRCGGKSAMAGMMSWGIPKGHHAKCKPPRK